MQPNQYKINILVIYSRQHSTAYQTLQRLTGEVRKEWLNEGVSALISHALPIEDFQKWRYTALHGLKNAHIVLLLVNPAFFEVDISALQKTLATHTQPDVVLAAAPMPGLAWAQTGFYQWLNQYFELHLLTQLLAPQPAHILPQDELSELISFTIHMQQQKTYRLNLHEGNLLFKQKRWLEAGDKFQHALEMGYETESETDLFHLYEKIEICRHELQFDQLVKLGKKAYQLHNYPKAYHYFEHATQIKPVSSVVLLREDCLRTPIPPHKLMKQFSAKDWFFECLHEGDRLFMLKKWDAAHEQYEEAIAVHDFSFEYNLSNIYRRLKECRTERCFEETITLARQAYKAKNHHEALAFFEEACNIKPNDPTAQRLYQKCRRIVTLKNMLPWAKYVIGILLLPFLLGLAKLIVWLLR